MEMQEALDRCEYAIRHQQEEIARLRAELERKDEELTQLLAWINGDSDALTVLQRTYMDPRNIDERSDQSLRCCHRLRAIQADAGGLSTQFGCFG